MKKYAVLHEPGLEHHGKEDRVLMEHIEFSCPPGELSCIIGNLFVSLEPPCKYVRSTHLMLCGITHSGNSGRLLSPAS